MALKHAQNNRMMTSRRCCMTFYISRVSMVLWFTGIVFMMLMLFNGQEEWELEVSTQNGVSPVEYNYKLAKRHPWSSSSLHIDTEAVRDKEHSMVLDHHPQHLSLWPNISAPANDRIINQLMVTHGSNEHHQVPKTVFVHSGLYSLGVQEGTHEFRKCPVSRCQFVKGKLWRHKADAVIFEYPPEEKPHRRVSRPKNQIWILHNLHSPMSSGPFSGFPSPLNWSMTYRSDSELVMPDAKFVLYEHMTMKEREVLKQYRVRSTTPPETANRNTNVAWFSSDCQSHNNHLQYVRDLEKHIEVDMYGPCGTLECLDDNPPCGDIYERGYTFLLAFENSNCRGYITGSFFEALRHNVIPVVMGAPKKDYQAIAPPHSFIHVDDFESPRHLADYLSNISDDVNLRRQYLEWHNTGVFIDTDIWCRFCALLHNSNHHVTWYEDINWWWRKDCVCSKGSWNEQLNCVTDWKKYKNY